ncbi:MAG TPA: tetratricopeptide repeat protein, partial [Ktedonobacteraceae bacterium]|nr:tetratricopeptide repeat protein [Ktedonobacteraceae bacterium]
MQPATKTPRCDVVILTALALEREAVLAHLTTQTEVRHPEGTVYIQGTLVGAQRTWQVAVAEIGMGGLRAASETQRAFTYFQPLIALFIGVAGGLKDVALGDVVASSAIFAYEPGKIVINQGTEAFQARLESWPASFALAHRARAEASNGSWLHSLELPPGAPVPRVWVAPIAAGEKVLAAQEASLAQFLREHCGDAVAIDMESHGFLQTAHAHPDIQVMVIRGISDLLENKSETDKKGWQPIAARHAAAFAFEMLAHFAPPEPSGRRPPELVLSDHLQLRAAPYFTDRVQDKQWLCQQLVQNPPGRVVTLAAPGGMGKTSLVAETMSQIFSSAAGTSRFPHGCFLHDFYRQPNVAVALERLATRLGPSEGTRSKSHPPASAAQEVLRSRTLLLIFDGVENLTQPDDLSTLLDACRGQTILLLTRNRSQMVDPQAMRDLTTLQPDDALDVLKSWTQNTPCLTDNQFRLLCQLVGNLPLALRIAGRYLCLHPNEAPAYLEELLQSRLSVLEQEAKEHESIPILLQRTIARLSESAQQGLAAIALFAPAPFWREFLAEVLDWPLMKLRQALSELQDYSLLVATQQQYEVSHALVHTYTQTELLSRLPPTLRTTYERRLVAALSTQLGTEETLPERTRQLLPHIRACLNLPEQDRHAMLERAWLFNRTGTVLCQYASYAEAAVMYWQALMIKKQQFRPEDQQIVPSLTSLANVYAQLGRYKGAEKLYQDALAICEQHPDPAYVVNGLTELAHFYSDQGKYTEAEPLYVRALTICKQRFGENHPNTASGLTNLANMYFRQEWYTEAEPLYRQALTISEQQFGKEHPNLVLYLHNLANIYIHSKYEYTKAKPLYERALAICERHFGENHLKTAKSLDKLAYFYICRYRYTKARRLYERALAIRERHFGKDHLEAAKSLDNLASVYIFQDGYVHEYVYYAFQRKWRQAVILYGRALAIRERHFGKDHPETAKSLDNLASVYIHRKKYRQAVPLYERALAIREQQFGKDHPETAKSLNNLADLYFAWKKYTKARRLYEQALDIYRQKGLDINHPAIMHTGKNYTRAFYLNRKRLSTCFLVCLATIIIFANTYFSVPSKLSLFASIIVTIVLSIVITSLIAFRNAMERKNPVIQYFRQGRDIRAERLLYGLALAASKQSLSFNAAPDNLDDLDNLANSHLRQGRYAEAEPLYIQAIDICKQRFGLDHLITATYLNKLANVYVRQGKYIVYPDRLWKSKVSRAQPLYEHALSSRKRYLDAKHPDIADTLNALANMYFRHGMYAKAQRSYGQSQAIYKQQPSPNYPKLQHIQKQYIAAVKLKYLQILYYIFTISAIYIGFNLLFLKQTVISLLVTVAVLVATFLFGKYRAYSVREMLKG